MALESDGLVTSLTDSSLSKSKWELALPIRHFQIENGEWRSATVIVKLETAAANSFWQLDKSKWPWKFLYGSWQCRNGRGKSNTALGNPLRQFHIQTSRQTPKLAGAQIQLRGGHIEIAIRIG